MQPRSRLIILDDPISSFDKNKKFAIPEMLFRRNTGGVPENETVIDADSRC